MLLFIPSIKNLVSAPEIHEGQTVSATHSIIKYYKPLAWIIYEPWCLFRDIVLDPRLLYSTPEQCINYMTSSSSDLMRGNRLICHMRFVSKLQTFCSLCTLLLTPRVRSGFWVVRFHLTQRFKQPNKSSGNWRYMSALKEEYFCCFV